MSIEFDMSEVRELIHDMRGVEPALARHLKPAVAKGALNIKNQLRDEMGQSAHFRAADSISFDLIDDGYGAEIGPTKTGAGPISNIAYFGGSNGGGGTVPDPRGALEEEAEKFGSALAQIASELL